MKGWSRCKADWIGHSSSGVRNKYGSSKGSSLVSSFLACIFLLSSEHHGGLSLPQWQKAKSRTYCISEIWSIVVPVRPVGDSVEKELRLAIEEASYVCRLAIDVDVDVGLLLDC